MLNTQQSKPSQIRVGLESEKYIKKLSSNDLGLGEIKLEIMSTLIKLSDSDGFSFPSYRHVATLTGLKRSTVIRNMNELVLNGWVIKKTVKSECGRLDLNNLYQLNLKKIEKIHA